MFCFWSVLTVANSASHSSTSRTGGCDDANMAMKPALSSEWGSATSRAPCPLPLDRVLPGSIFRGLDALCWLGSLACGRATFLPFWGAGALPTDLPLTLSASFHRSVASKRATGKQSLSSSMKWITVSARSNVPAHVWWTLSNPVAWAAGTKRSSLMSLFGPMYLSLLAHQVANVNQWGSDWCGVQCCVRSLSVIDRAIALSARMDWERGVGQGLANLWGNSPLESLQSVGWGSPSCMEVVCMEVVQLEHNAPKNCDSHVDASHSRQPLAKGERLVRYEVNAVMDRGVEARAFG